mmetsp:Transcript_37170/g.60369  ORF Transcript_37170/g.60369 Transcript_37170/m.60369 type:complete len:302 (-) Transcript_37170:313-1218(-)
MVLEELRQFARMEDLDAADSKDNSATLNPYAFEETIGSSRNQGNDASSSGMSEYLSKPSENYDRRRVNVVDVPLPVVKKKSELKPRPETPLQKRLSLIKRGGGNQIGGGVKATMSSSLSVPPHHPKHQQKQVEGHHSDAASSLPSPTLPPLQKPKPSLMMQTLSAPADGLPGVSSTTESLPSSSSSASLPITETNSDDTTTVRYNEDQSQQPKMNEKKKKKKKKDNYVQISIPEKANRRRPKQNVVDVASDDDDIMRNNEGGQTSCNVAPSLTSDYVSLQAKPKREDSTGGMGDVHAATGK